MLKKEMKKLMVKIGRLVQSSTAFLEFENHTYSIVKAESNWAEAVAACEEIGEKAHLLHIDSFEEMEFIRSQIEVSSDIYWIGMTDEEEEKTWKWTDGTVVAQDIQDAFWYQGNSDGSSVQPNGGTAQNCGQLRSEFSNNDAVFERADNNYFNDFYCDRPGLTAFRICEVDAPVDTVYSYYYDE